MGLQSLQSCYRAGFLVATTACLILFILILHQQHIGLGNFLAPKPHSTAPQGADHDGSGFGFRTPCHELPGADDVLLVLRTGATEAHAKLPVHFSTTLRCVPHYALFSDLTESIDGHTVLDTLDEVPAAVRAEAGDDFALYDQIHDWRNQGVVDLAQIAANDSLSSSSWGMLQRAWALDKWKFLPLMEKAFRVRPQAKWFVFIEADTALVWTNLLRWLQLFDAHKPWYIGSQTWIDSTPFAHAGAGFILSAPALNRLVDRLTAEPNWYPFLTRTAWAGDHVLARALAGVGVHLTMAWPILQGETPYTLDYSEHHWCFPVVSWHHMSPAWVRRMWAFEQVFMGAWWNGRDPGSDWFDGKGEARLMRHHHVFEEFVAPHVRVPERPGWDNLSPDLLIDEGGLGMNKANCRRACEEMENCMQWSWIETGACKTAKVVRLGKPAELEGMTSGWVRERVERFMERLKGCRMGE